MQLTVLRPCRAPRILMHHRLIIEASVSVRLWPPPSPMHRARRAPCPLWVTAQMPNRLDRGPVGLARPVQRTSLLSAPVARLRLEMCMPVVVRLAAQHRDVACHRRPSQYRHSCPRMHLRSHALQPALIICGTHGNLHAYKILLGRCLSRTKHQRAGAGGL